MEERAGKMGAGMAWGFMLIGVVLSTALMFIGMKSHLPDKLYYIGDIVFFGGAAWAGVFLTKAGKGIGVLTTIVAGIIVAIVSYMVASWVLSSAVSAMGGAVGTLAADPTATRTAEAAGGLFGAIGGIIVAVLNFVCVLGAGIPGAIVGGNMKASVLGGQQRPQRAKAA